MALTLSDLQPLLDQFRVDGLTVSCYADLSAAPGILPPWPGHFKTKVAAVEKMLADDPRALAQFEDNCRAIGRALEAPEARHARGMAVFAALQRGFFQAHTLEVPVADELVVHEAPYLAPLLQALCRQREYLVVHSDTHRGRLYLATPGSLQLLEEIEEAVPSRQRSAGERWGMEQATIARHREDRILHYQKELVERIEKAWADHPLQGMVLLGEHEQLEHLRKHLPARLAGRVVYEGPHAWTEKPLGVAEAVRSALADAARAEEERLLAGVEKRLHQGYGIATGPREVVDALQGGRLGARGYGYLVLGPDPREAVARCTACRSLFIEMPGTCPRCQAPCVDANLWEEILLLALRHDIAAHCVEASALLAPYGGVIAVLPDQGPRQAAPANLSLKSP